MYLLESPRRGDSNKYSKRMFFPKNNMGLSIVDQKTSLIIVIIIMIIIIIITEDPRYNDSVCYQRFCCKIEFAVKTLDMDPSKA